MDTRASHAYAYTSRSRRGGGAARARWRQTATRIVRIHRGRARVRAGRALSLGQTHPRPLPRPFDRMEPDARDDTRLDVRLHSFSHAPAFVANYNGIGLTDKLGTFLKTSARIGSAHCLHMHVHHERMGVSTACRAIARKRCLTSTLDCACTPHRDACDPIEMSCVHV